jgi:hypothetical protein
MVRSMKKLILISTLLLTSCVSWFVNDAGPAMRAKVAQTEQFLEVCDNFREIISNSTGATPDQKSAILLKISAAVEAYRAFEIEQIDYLKSVDGENHEQLFREAMELFIKFYGRN